MPMTKEQRKAYNKEYAKKNKERLREAKKTANKRWREKNCVKDLERKRKYREQNAEKIKAYGREYAAINAEKISARKELYMRLYRPLYRKANQKRITALQVAWVKRKRRTDPLFAFKKREEGLLWRRTYKQRILNSAKHKREDPAERKKQNEWTRISRHRSRAMKTIQELPKLAQYV